MSVFCGGGGWGGGAAVTLDGRINIYGDDQD
jgi:hypothetical protein